MLKNRYIWGNPNPIYETKKVKFYCVKTNDFGFGFKVCKTKSSGEVPSYIWLRIQFLKHILHFIFAVNPHKKTKYQSVKRKE